MKVMIVSLTVLSSLSILRRALSPRYSPSWISKSCIRYLFAQFPLKTGMFSTETQRKFLGSHFDINYVN